jgi:hypothetical protein
VLLTIGRRLDARPLERQQLGAMGATELFFDASETRERNIRASTTNQSAWFSLMEEAVAKKGILDNFRM